MARGFAALISVLAIGDARADYVMDTEDPPVAEAVMFEFGVGGLVGGFFGPSGVSPGFRFPVAVSHGRARMSLEYDLMGVERGDEQALVHRAGGLVRWSLPLQATRNTSDGLYLEAGGGYQHVRAADLTFKRWDVQLGIGISTVGLFDRKGSRWSYGVMFMAAPALPVATLARCASASCAPERRREYGIFYAFDVVLTRARADATRSSRAVRASGAPTGRSDRSGRHR